MFTKGLLVPDTCVACMGNVVIKIPSSALGVGHSLPPSLCELLHTERIPPTHQKTQNVFDTKVPPYGH